MTYEEPTSLWQALIGLWGVPRACLVLQAILFAVTVWVNLHRGYSPGFAMADALGNVLIGYFGATSLLYYSKLLR